MQVALVDMLFTLSLILFVCVCVVFVCFAIMHVLIPKPLLEAYFKEPYFKHGEKISFTGFPFGYIRTVMFMGLMGFPKSGRKRGLMEAYKLAPVWMCHFSRWVLIFFCITIICLVSVLLTFFFFF
ncbi:MAG: hypothetical protein K6L73_09975 [Cellvibrionaceae bacterium]